MALPIVSVIGHMRWIGRLRIMTEDGGIARRMNFVLRGYFRIMNATLPGAITSIRKD